MPKQHEEDLKKIQQEFKEWRAGTSVNCRAGHYSNMMRKRSYRSFSPSIPLNRFLEIDIKNRFAWVEPNVNMRQLVAATLPFGLIPAVVPEFKGITVGGAINGAALESSSHIFGQFNDRFMGYEVLIGDGNVIWANDKDHAALFHGISGSYGTLGKLLSAKVTLMPASPFVCLRYHRFGNVQNALDFIEEMSSQKKPPDYLEAIVYGPNNTVVIVGEPCGNASNRHKLSLGKPWSPWFYQQAFSNTQEQVIPLVDYLFRHDRGAFWMGGYALDPRMIFSYCLHKAGAFIGKDLSAKALPKQAMPKHPGKLFRGFCGWAMGSEFLYGSLHGGSEEWFEEHFVIQDVYIPKKETAEFVNESLAKHRITPIWICPIRSTMTPQLLSPHRSENQELLFDIGIYGYPYDNRGPAVVRDLEKMTIKAKGKKMFYCHCYLNKETFWHIYPSSAYRSLRETYQCDQLSPDITDKVLKSLS